MIGIGNRINFLPGRNLGGGIADAVAPTVISATVNYADKDALVVVFSEAVNVTNVTGLSLDGSWTGVSFTAIQSGNGTSTVTFTLSRDLILEEAGNFVYAGTNTIQDLAGNPLATGSIAVTNSIVDAFGPELYIANNCLAMGVNEADGTTGIGAVGVTLESVESPVPPFGQGSSILTIAPIDGASDRAEIDMTLESGAVYRIAVDAWDVPSDSSSLYANSWVGFSAFSLTGFTTTPARYIWELTTTQTAIKFRFYNNQTDVNIKLFLDRFSVRKKL